MAVDLLERPTVAAVPPALLQAVVRHYAPIEVILFGSRARGDFGPDSDWDLLVVTDEAADRPERREPPRWPAPATVIPCTRSGFEADRDLIGTLANMADVDGVVIWRRQGASVAHRRRRIVSAAENWRVARRWFERAEQDLEVARTLMPLGDRQLDNTALHLQQAAEKILKGILAAGARPFRKTHGLGELAGWVSDRHPDMTSELQGLDPYTSWAGAGRYPDARTDVPITRETVQSLLQRCEALLGRAQALAPDRKGSA